MNLWVEGFDPTVENFRGAGEAGDFQHGQSGLLQGFGGAAGGEKFDFLADEKPGEIEQAGFVRD
jgi:hypothetical protein